MRKLALGAVLLLCGCAQWVPVKPAPDLTPQKHQKFIVDRGECEREVAFTIPPYPGGVYQSAVVGCMEKRGWHFQSN